MAHTIRRALGLAGALLVALGPVGTSRAGDGVVEINAARVSAGDVTPGDEPGYPVTIDRSGSYRLTGSLSVRDATAIEIETDHVTLDLNGFVLSCFTLVMPLGTPCTSGRDVDAEQSDHVVVRDGRVVGFGGDGIHLDRSGVVEAVHAADNGGHGIVASSGSRIERCTTRDNAGHGISARGSILDNSAVSNEGHGIQAGIGVVRGNEVVLNEGHGIELLGRGTLLGNHVDSNGGCGLRILSPAGYARNVIQANNASSSNLQVHGGQEIGGNLCGAQDCETGTRRGAVRRREAASGVTPGPELLVGAPRPGLRTGVP